VTRQCPSMEEHLASKALRGSTSKRRRVLASSIFSSVPSSRSRDRGSLLKKNGPDAARSSYMYAECLSCVYFFASGAQHLEASDRRCYSSYGKVSTQTGQSFRTLHIDKQKHKAFVERTRDRNSARHTNHERNQLGV
jgi:hypothetical protein